MHNQDYIKVYYLQKETSIIDTINALFFENISWHEILVQLTNSTCSSSKFISCNMLGLLLLMSPLLDMPPYFLFVFDILELLQSHSSISCLAFKITSKMYHKAS